MKRIDSHPFLSASLQGEEITWMFKYLPSTQGNNTVHDPDFDIVANNLKRKKILFMREKTDKPGVLLF